MSTDITDTTDTDEEVLKARLKQLLDDESLEDLPDGAFWAIINERLGLEPGDAEEMIASDPDYFEALPILHEAGHA